MKRFEVSIVVCVADDTRISHFLESARQNCEIVVVLNGATQAVKDIVNRYQEDGSNDIRIVEIAERNLGKARNIGIQIAKYSKVVFYDSDCIIVGNAIELYDKTLEIYMLVDGRVEFRADNPHGKTVAVMRKMGVPGKALCPSIGINKAILEKISYFFDERIRWIEDSELNDRAIKAGIEIGRIDEITCIHDNLSYGQDLRSAFYYGRGVRTAAYYHLHKKRPNANWKLIIPCFKKRIRSGFYAILWNLVYCLGYMFGRYK